MKKVKTTHEQDISAADDGDTTRIMDHDDSTTILDMEIEQQLVGKSPHEAVFTVIMALYQRKDFEELIAKKGQHIVVVDPTCRVVFKPDLFKVSRKDAKGLGSSSSAGTFKQFAYDKYFEKYKREKLSESFRSYDDNNNELMLELGRIKLVDLMNYARKECMDVIHYMTEAQAKALVYPHLYRFSIFLSKCNAREIPFYSESS
ncbi:MAG: hypothetical protein HQL84_08555 [Magnetococcales bacterium]|nr:hypothetical protein [Magnetococcales bacterium]MBF0150081.1 hypothetical protein [Magnetococcales bacterium]